MKKKMGSLLADFQGLGNLKVFSSAYRHALKNKTRESCGIFHFSECFSEVIFSPIQNKDEYDKNHFIINEPTFYKEYISNRIISLYHSHINHDSTPSNLDIEVAESLSLPSFILSTKDKSKNLFYPSSFNPRPLSRRIFIPYFQDCVSFAKDFFDIKLGIKLSYSISNWSRQGLNSNNALIFSMESIFNSVDFYSIKNYDIVVFKPNIDRYYHLGIFVEDRFIYHHPIYGYPIKELFTPELFNKVYKVYRYKDL